MERGSTVWLLLALAAAAAAAAAAADGAEDSFAGDACKLKGGSQGVCRNLDNCTAAREALKKGQHPEICSYEGLSPVVCCPSERVAARMCTKYGEAVYRYEKTWHIPPQTVKVDQCAIRGLPFIVGGEKAVSDEFPHMALLGYSEDSQDPQWGCGGALISERFVLTAAHCIVSSKGSPKIVRLGELNLKNDKESNRHEDFKVAQSIPHPDYKDGVYYNDLGLLRLARDVTFTASIRPACVQTLREFGDEDAVASGWGYTDWATPEITEHLMKVKMPIQKTEFCSNAYKTLATTFRLSNGITEESMMCAGNLQGGLSTCRGDSGGPLQVKLKTPYCMHSIVGVTSFGKGKCGIRNSPTIFTRVSHFVPWIESHVWPN